MCEISIMSVAFPTLMRHSKKCNDIDNTEDVKLKCNYRFVSKPGRKRIIEVDEATSEIILHACSHLSIITNPIEDSHLLLNVINNINNNRLIANNRFSPRKMAISDYTN